MRVLVISGRTARHPWTPGGLVARAAAALAQRGHTITLACQSLDDQRAFAFCAGTQTFDSFNQTATDWPYGFAAWARRRRRTIDHNVSLSFARTAAGDVWMPLEPTGASWLRRARLTLSPKSLAIAVGRHHGALRAWASDRFFIAPPTGEDEPIRRVVAVGTAAAGEASRLLQRAKGLGGRVVQTEKFAALAPPSADELRDLRRQTRELLSIDTDRLVVFISVPHPVGPLLDRLFEATADLASRDREHAPLVLALARDCFALHARAARRGCAEHIRIQGLTTRIDAALAAADAVALPLRAPRGAFEAGAMGRLAVEALRFGRPILAVPGAPGHELARRRSTSDDTPGLVLDGVAPTRDAWTRALKQAANDAWLDRAGAAAAQIGATLTFDRFIDTLERTLADAAAERIGHGPLA